MQQKKLLVSTDLATDIDDAIALYLFAQCPEILLKGVYVTSGNLEVRSKITKKMLNMMCYKEVAVGIGEANPLVDKQINSPPYLGFEPLFLTKEEHEKSLRDWGIEEDGLSSMEKRLEEGDFYIASIAPLTNLARLLQRDSSIPKKVKKVYVMGGEINGAEHNFYHDVEAAQQVFDSDFDITVIPLNVCDKFKLNAAYLCDLKGSAIREYISGMASVWKTCQEIIRLRGFGLASVLKEINERNRYFNLTPELEKSVELILNYTFFIKNYTQMSDFYRMFKASVGSDKFSIAKKIIADVMKEEEIREFWVSDAYVVYSLLYPEKTEKKRVEIKVEKSGIMRVCDGDKHELIVGLDYSDFKAFLKKYLG